MSVLVFPGQGPSLFMGGLKYKPVQEVLNRAKEILGYDVMDLSIEQQKRTDYSQMRVFMQSMAILELYKHDSAVFGETDISFVAGHSLGQYSACVAAGVFDFDTGIKLVQKRGEFMQKCVERNPGGMVACIGINVESSVEEIIGKMEDVFIANYNSKSQIVISGKLEPVQRATEECRRHGFRCLQLQVAGAFQTPLMNEANTEMSKELSEVTFQDPIGGFISNRNGQILTKGNQIKEDLMDQITEPVRWTKMMETMRSIESRIYEIGPGTDLSKLIESTLGIPVTSLETLDTQTTTTSSE